MYKLSGTAGSETRLTKHDASIPCDHDYSIGCADLPYAWVNLRHGVGPEEKRIEETNAAAVGSFTLEFGLLSRLTGNTHALGV